MEKKDIKNTCEGRGWTYTDKWGGAPMPGCRVSAFVEEWGSVRPAAVAIVLRPLEGGAWSASEVGHGSLGVVEREGDLVEAVERAKENYLERVGRPVGVRDTTIAEDVQAVRNALTAWGCLTFKDLRKDTKLTVERLHAALSRLGMNPIPRRNADPLYTLAPR